MVLVLGVVGKEDPKSNADAIGANTRIAV